MPDSQHFDLLKQGVCAWNQWRQEHPEVLPDLNGANMAWVYLSRIDLSGANLSGADLTWADLYAVLAGRMRLANIRIVAGDKVRVALSPYDLNRGRIVWRIREGEKAR